MSMFEEPLGWIAPAATMIAAMMTATNAGARVTGWGFVVFSIDSIAWVGVAVWSSQSNLLLTNLFLTLVNIVGVWRWLGRQATHEVGSIRAIRKSRRAIHAPTLFSASAAIGANVVDANGEKLGAVVDLMLKRDQRNIAYVVIAQYGLGGLDETLRVLDPTRLDFAGEVVRARLSAKEFEALPAIEGDNWPSALPGQQRERSAGASEQD